ncbi:MAG: patatin-like phospholipase family protein, partial [Gammaproteobacteria bacterium]
MGTERPAWRRFATLLAICAAFASWPLPLAASETSPPRSVGLALGSGGAAGLAHIAMLEVFDQLELRPDAIAGTSIGAV